MSEWQTFCLKDLVKIFGGSTPPTNNPKNYGNKIRWITAKDLSTLQGRYIKKGSRSISRLGFKSCSTFLLPKHAILFSVRAPIGYTAIISKRSCTDRGLMGLVPNKKIYFEFLYYLLKYHKDNISNMGVGTTFKGISKPALGLFKVKIPPTYYKQQKIARTLSILDQKIENNHKINELLHTLAYKIYEYYFKYKPKNAKLEQIIIENPKSSIMVKNAQKTQDKYPFFTSGDNILSYPKAIIDGRNCFLNTGGNAGIKFYVGKASYSTDTWCICANEFSDYLYLLLSSIKNHINQSFFQGTSLKHLQKNLLKKYPIYMPSAHEIKKFNQIMMPLLTLISINTRTSKKLEQIRDFLLPLLLKQQVKPQ
ncbi:restriction endonuclease subunit S [Helicobacter pylori]|uniref:restriction endonuclease subunit S n=1 Tax=Helicobacter pylori TaxID=210 RepID=UPI000FDD15A8|nr:restriction endonuclease subunit S [Helicobacter pylori]RVZ47143.1 restriction endonuclease subunit S [Helicobacter pylori]WQW88910.1 restriction endonuclease subunit S [Helicobacter pylori]